MKANFLTIFFLICLFCISCVNKPSSEAGNESSERVESSSEETFTAISVGGGLNVLLQKGEACKVRIEATEAQLERIENEVRNGTLHLGFKSNMGSWMNDNSDIKIYVTYTTLESISGSGGSDLKAEDNISAEKLSISGSGGSDLDLALEVKVLDIDISGGSDIALRGSAGDIAINASGGSDLNAFELIGQQVIVSASGGSDVEISAESSLNASASGAASVHYKGSVEDVDSNTSGAGKVSRKD